MSRIVEAECKACYDRSKKKLTPEDVEQMALPGTGHVVFDNGPWRIIISYCANCLGQVAWLVIDEEMLDEREVRFAKINWQKID